MLNKRLVFLLLAVLSFLPAGMAQGAQELIYGLESIKIENVFDPNTRPERLMLVSGSLKLVGSPRGNAWKAVMYIPRRSPVPKSDYGIFKGAGDQMRFYSFITFSSYTARVVEDGNRIVIEKINRDGQSQTEVWYRVR